MLATTDSPRQTQKTPDRPRQAQTDPDRNRQAQPGPERHPGQNTKKPVSGRRPKAIVKAYLKAMFRGGLGPRWPGGHKWSVWANRPRPAQTCPDKPRQAQTGPDNPRQAQKERESAERWTGLPAECVKTRNVFEHQKNEKRESAERYGCGAPGLPGVTPPTPGK